VGGRAGGGAQRRAGRLVVAAEQHVDLGHALPKIGRLVATDEVGGGVRGERDAVLQPVQLDVLLQVLRLGHAVGRVARDAHQLVRVQVHNLVKVLLEDHDRAAGVLVGRNHRVVTAGEADQAIHRGCSSCRAERGQRRRRREGPCLAERGGLAPG